jgi:hypothetical protein
MHRGRARGTERRYDLFNALDTAGSEQQAGAFRSEGPRAGSADAGTGSGNENNAIFQTEFWHDVYPSEKILAGAWLRLRFVAAGKLQVSSGPVLVFHAGFEGLMKGCEKEIGERGRQLLGVGRFAKQAHIFFAEAHRCSGSFRWVKHDFSVHLVER